MLITTAHLLALDELAAGEAGLDLLAVQEQLNSKGVAEKEQPWTSSM